MLFKNQSKFQLEQQFKSSYARWMRLSRTNELGEEPHFIVRPVDCALSVTSVREKLRETYDVDALLEGMARLLRAQGHGKPKGSERAGLTIRQVREGLWRERGLPILAYATNENFENALQRMAQDAGDNGIVVQAGKALYGYDEVVLPSVLSDDWRIWLKPYAPEPPAKEDVKQRVRQELAKVRAQGLSVRDLKTLATRETGLATEEVVRAVVELVNDKEAIVEQGEARFPDDGMLSSAVLTNEGHVWLTEHAPPDDRRARSRILELARGAGEKGIPYGQVQAHLSAEGLTVSTVERAVERVMADANRLVECYEATGQTAIHEPGPPTAATLLRLHKEALPPLPPPGWQPFDVRIQPYRLPMSTDLLMDEFRTRLRDGCRVREVTFLVHPVDKVADPLFGGDENVARLARVQVEHKLTWQFEQPASKEALLNLVTNLLRELGQKGEVLVEALLEGEVPQGGS